MNMPKKIFEGACKNEENNAKAQRHNKGLVKEKFVPLRLGVKKLFV